MLLPFANPVISAMVLPDVELCVVFDQCRTLHRDIQAEDRYSESKFWEPNIVYLMLIGDCMAREIRRRNLNYPTNLILQNPSIPFPEYWLRIPVPDRLHEVVERQKNVVWGPDLYPEPQPEIPEEQPVEVTDGAE